MGQQLLIHVYNVGVGDCIYLQVPDKTEDDKETLRHIVIDCGTKDPNRDERLLVDAMNHIVNKMLPPPGENLKKQLDLLVVSHPHMDHYAGFGLDSTQALWDRVEVKQLWLNATMDSSNKKAERAQSLGKLTGIALQALREANFHPAISRMADELLSLNQDQIARRAQAYLRSDKFKTLKYIDDKTRAEDLKIFDEKGTSFHVLAPAHDFDDEILGTEKKNSFAAIEAHLGDGDISEDNWKMPEEKDLTISMIDFRRLRARMANMILAMAMAENEVVNNGSIVLLLNWRGHRLLFTGDAECKFSRNGKYEKGKQNFSWNVMAEHHPEHLLKPLDFLKVGHHGSENASPWAPDDPDNEANNILEAIAPKAGNTKLHAVVSATRYRSWPKNIPRRALMEELGRRVLEPRETYDEWEVYQHKEGRYWPQKEDERREILVQDGVPQPMRTDLEHQHNGQSDDPVLFITVKFP